MSSIGPIPPRTTFRSLLKLASDSISGSLKEVQDGGGVPTAIKLSNQLLEANRLDLINADNQPTPTNILTRVSNSIRQTSIADFINTISGFNAVYDSGWKLIPDWTSGSAWGVTNINNQPRLPRVRVIGRQVFFDGDLWIPNTDTDFDTITNNVNVFGSTATTNLVSAPTASKVVLAPLIPASLSGNVERISFPESSRLRRVYEVVDAAGGAGNVIGKVILRGRCSVDFNSNTEIYSIKGLQNSQDYDYLTSTLGFDYHPEWILQNRAIADDSFEQLSGYYTSWETTSKRVVSDSGEFFFDNSVDLNIATNFAGSFVRLDGLFLTFSGGTDLNTIKTLFNAI